MKTVYKKKGGGSDKLDKGGVLNIGSFLTRVAIKSPLSLSQHLMYYYSIESGAFILCPKDVIVSKFIHIQLRMERK